MLRSSSCWFEFYSVIIERERQTEIEKQGAGRRDRERESGGKRKRREKKGRRQVEKRHIFIYTKEMAYLHEL